MTPAKVAFSLCACLSPLAVAQAPRVQSVLLRGDTGPGRAGEITSILGFDCAEPCRVAVHVSALDALTRQPRDVLLGGCLDTLDLVAVGGDAEASLPPGARTRADHIAAFATESSGGTVWTTTVVTADGDRRAIFRAARGGPVELLAMVGEPARELGAGMRWETLGNAVESAQGPMWIGSATSAEGAAVTALCVVGRPLARLGEVVAGTREATIASFAATTPICRGEGFSGPWRLRRGAAEFAAACTGVPTRVLLAGDGPLANFPSAVRLSQVVGMGGNDAGEVVIHGTMTGPGITTENESVLWRWRGDSPDLLARGGNELPGVPGVRILSFGQAVINAGSEIFASATLTGAGVTAQNDTAVVMLNRFGQRALVAREGSPVESDPALSFGHVLFATGNESWSGYCNARGQFLMNCTLTGPSAPPETMRALALWSPETGVRLLVREGQTARVRGRETTLTRIWTPTTVDDATPMLAGGEDGRRTALDDRGCAYFAASYTLDGLSGEGLFRAQLPDEPCAADFNRDAFIDCSDYDDFVIAFGEGEHAADLNGDDFLDFFDYEDFVAIFETGC